MKTLILPQFPFLFPWALVCFLFLGSRRGKLETRPFLGDFTYEDARKLQRNKAAETRPQFPCCPTAFVSIFVSFGRFSRK